MYGQLTKINGSNATIKLDSQLDVNKISKVSNDNVPTVELIIDDGRSISAKQRKKIFALINDMSNFVGYFQYECEAILKSEFIRKMKHPHNFHFTRQECSMELANEFLTFEIGYLIDHNIPFKTKVFDEIRGNYGLVRKCVKQRKCIICGKPNADIDHVITVGAGRNRRTIDQRGMEVWSLCRKHHQERHMIGVKSFAQKYKIKPIKLDNYLIKQLGLQSEKIIKRNEDNDG